MISRKFTIFALLSVLASVSALAENTAYMIEKYGLTNPINWQRAQTVAEKLKSTAAALHREGQSKAERQDRRSTLDGTVTDLSHVRLEGKEILERSAAMSQESKTIFLAIEEARQMLTDSQDSLTPMREWTSKDGSRTITARVLSIDAMENLILHLEGGNVLSVSRVSFSESDLTYLEGEIFLEQHLVAPDSVEDQTGAAAFAAEGALQDWSFSSVELTKQGQLVQDAGEWVVLALADGNFYRVQVSDLSDMSRGRIEQDRLLASARITEEEASSKLAGIAEIESWFGHQDWKLSDLDAPLNGRLIDIDDSNIFIVSPNAEYYSLPTEKLAAEHDEDLKLARFIQERLLTPDSLDVRELGNSYHDTDEREWSFKNVDLVLEGRVVQDDGNEVVLASSQGNYYRIQVRELSGETREWLERSRVYARAPSE